MDKAVIDFEIGSHCRFELICPNYIEGLPLINLKKLFELMCKASQGGEKAIDTTARYIDLCLAKAKSEWHEASVQFQNGYTDTKCRYELTKKQKQTIERENKKLYNNVKSCKSAYDRMVKVQDAFFTTKQRFTD